MAEAGCLGPLGPVTPPHPDDRGAELPSAPGAVREARSRVAEALRGTCSTETIETAALLTSELVANAVGHGAPPLRLWVVVDDTIVRVEVHDGDGSAVPERRSPEPTDSAGRGLAIVDALAMRWGTRPDADGKWVWFELPT